MTERMLRKFAWPAVFSFVLALPLLAAALAPLRAEEAAPAPQAQPAAKAEPAGKTAPAAKPAAPAAARPRPVPEDLEYIRDVEYGKGGGRALRLDILRPKQPPAQPMPVVVYIHGGAWRGGSRAAMPLLCNRLAQEGYFCASIEYRLSQESPFPAQIEDCKCAIRFLRARAKEYNINPDRIGVWGHSAGGHLVALLGTSGDAKDLEGTGGWQDQSSRVQAVLDCFGPADFTIIPKWAEGIQEQMKGPVYQLLGGPVAENAEKAAKASPITHVSKDDPPILIMHGDQDFVVPLDQSVRLAEALKKAGVDVTLHVVKGAGHGFRGQEIEDMTAAFFDKHLKGRAVKP
ncbi:MAG: alpha/beta hydrolase [Planctomycetes bacterium]|nr:alpha/beta hydrolase [Planctomycetota bacterium]